MNKLLLTLLAHLALLGRCLATPVADSTAKAFEYNDIHVTLENLHDHPADYNQKAICITGVVLLVPVFDGKNPAIFPLGTKAETVSSSDPAIQIDPDIWRAVADKKLFGKPVVICGYYVVPVDHLNVPGFYEFVRIDSMRPLEDKAGDVKKGQ